MVVTQRHDLTGEFMCSKGFILCSDKGLKASFYCGDGRVRDQEREGMRFISHHEIEQGLICDRVRAVVVGEHCMRDFVSLGIQVASTEDPKVYFNLLVDTFHLTIRLGVIGGGEREVVIKELPKFLGEDRSKLWTVVGDDFVIETKVKVDFMKKEGSYSLGSDEFLDETENYPLYKAMVDYHQQRIKARGDREVGDKITRYLLE